ncbi:hypothetical protein ACIQVR_41855 [Streptomyces xanthochromogenes]|uniref:hypothetical protein n=1 Tax=Streptomyces xanthochromogenes TaxID=67384 RepID=UPI00380AA05E
MALRDLGRLASQVKARRLELGPVPLKKAAENAGISKDTWMRVEAGKPVRDMNYAKIEPVLEWAPGSCVAVAEGRSAVPVAPSRAEPGVSISVLQPEHVDDEVREVVQLAAIATTSGLTADEIRALSDRVAKDLRTRGHI